MEKYRQFADETKGVNPFVPVWANHKSAIVFLLLRILLFPLILVKQLIFLIGFLWLALASVILGLLGPIGPLHNLCAKILLWPGCRLCLLGLGFFWVGSSV